MIWQNQIGKLRTAAFALAVFVGFVCGPALRADPVADSSVSGQVVDDFGVPVTNMTVFAFGQDSVTNTFSALTDGDGNFQMGVTGGLYFLQLDTDLNVGVLSRGLVSPRVFQTISSGSSVTNVTLVARRITGSITVTLMNGGRGGFQAGLVAKSTITLSGTAAIDSFDSADTNSWTGLYSTNKPAYDTNVITGIYDTNLIGGIYDTNILVPPSLYGATNFIGPTNLINPFYYTNYHFDEIIVSPRIPITNIEVAADLSGSFPSYIATAQRTDTNGIAVLYVCDGTWSLHPDCGALDAMNLDCQIYRSNVVAVANTNVAITLTYFTNAPLRILTNMVAGTNGVPYSGMLRTSGGYWPFTWTIVDGTLPPGLSTNQSASDQFTGLPTQEGSYTLTVQITDNLQQTTTTNLTITILPTPLPRLTAPLCLDASQFQLHLAGISNRNYTIQFTTDLINWTTLAVTNVIGPDTIFIDTNSADRMRIYRVVQGP